MAGLQEVAQIIVTKNIPELLDLPDDHRLLIIDNTSPKGFGANHNAAFLQCDQPFFCPLNPDIELSGNPFDALLREAHLPESGVIAPLVCSPKGEVEDSARYFPTPMLILQKLLGRGEGRYPFATGDKVITPDWVAGMFMLFQAPVYRARCGFDKRYFMYYEDVDICKRLNLLGKKSKQVLGVSVIHNAQRNSHRNLQHLRWHLKSMFRYFWTHWAKV